MRSLNKSFLVVVLSFFSILLSACDVSGPSTKPVSNEKPKPGPEPIEKDTLNDNKEEEVIKTDLGLNPYNTYKVGVIDRGKKDRKALFILSHNAKSTILHFSKAGALTSSFDIPHEPDFPSLRDLGPDERVNPENESVFYWKEKNLNIKSVQNKVKGSMEFKAQPVIEKSKGIKVKIEETDNDWVVHFQAVNNNNHLEISHTPKPAAGWPVDLKVDSGRVAIGSPSGGFVKTQRTLRLKDYHGLSSGPDINKDGRADILVAGGGLRGNASSIAPEARELFLITKGESDYKLKPGPRKKGCASTSVNWDDLNNAFEVSCKRKENANIWSVNANLNWSYRGKANYNQEVNNDCKSSLLVQKGHVDVREDSFCIESNFDSDSKLELVVVGEKATLFNLE